MDFCITVSCRSDKPLTSELRQQDSKTYKKFHLEKQPSKSFLFQNMVGGAWGVNKARVPTPSFLPQTRIKATGLTQCIQTYSLIIGGN